MLLADAGQAAAAAVVEEAVDAALREGVRTPDLGGTWTTPDVGAWLCRRIASSG